MNDHGPEITERGGDLAAHHQLARMVARYRWAAAACAGRVTAEVACGTGVGLGMLAASAARIVGTDLSPVNLAVARTVYGGRIPLVCGDAQRLPFATASIEAIVLLEALYFLSSTDAFLADARRVLRPGGILLISVVNRDCPGFDPSNPRYARTFGVRELAGVLAAHGFTATLAATTPVGDHAVRSRVVGMLKAGAVRLHLLPHSVASPWKQRLRRLVFGRLTPIPPTLPADAPCDDVPIEIPDTAPDRRHQALLATARATP